MKIIRASSNIPYGWDIAAGGVANHTPFRRYGHNADCGAALETVWHGSSLYIYLTSGERLYVVSDDVDDTIAGDGARTVTIKGLDTDYNIIQETIEMDGTTHVLTDASFFRVFKAFVATVGATGYNEGTITIKNNAEDNTLSTIIVQESESHACLWTVPADKKAFITDFDVSESSTKGAEVSLWVRDTGNGYPWRYKRGIYTLDNFILHEFTFPIIVSEKHDIEFRVKAILAGAKVSADFEGWYEPV